MKLIVIPCERRDSTMRGIEMSYWCRDQGLVRDKDYDWAFSTQRKELHFRFFDHAETFATLFTLRWS